MPMSATGVNDRLPSASERSLRRSDTGLSLIELLIALAIVGVMVGAVVIAFPDLTGRGLDTSAARLHRLIELACERAERSGRDFGIEIRRDGLRFGPFIDGRWQPVPEHSSEALRPRRLPEGQRLDLRIDGIALSLAEGSADGADPTPQIACLATGERAPFELRLSSDTDSTERRAWRIHADPVGPIRLEPTDAP